MRRCPVCESELVKNNTFNEYEEYIYESCKGCNFIEVVEVKHIDD